MPFATNLTIEHSRIFVVAHRGNSDMGIVRVKNPPRYMRLHDAYRMKKLGGHVGAASGVRRIDPETGEVIEEISSAQAKKSGVSRKPKPDNAPAPSDLSAAATAILRKNPEKKTREKQPRERSKKEIRQEISRLRKLRKAASSAPINIADQ